MKPSYRFVYFYRQAYNTPDWVTHYNYAPIGIGSVPITDQEMPLGQVRPELHDYALQQLDLPGYDDRN